MPCNQTCPATKHVLQPNMHGLQLNISYNQTCPTYKYALQPNMSCNQTCPTTKHVLHPNLSYIQISLFEILFMCFAHIHFACMHGLSYKVRLMMGVLYMSVDGRLSKLHIYDRYPFGSISVNTSLCAWHFMICRKMHASLMSEYSFK